MIVNSDGTSITITAPDGTICRMVASNVQSALLLITSLEVVNVIGVMSF